MGTKLVVMLGIMFFLATNAMAQSHENNLMTERAWELANQMGITGDSINIVTRGNVPIIINGKTVPPELLTEEERGATNVAKKVKDFIEGN